MAKSRRPFRRRLLLSLLAVLGVAVVGVGIYCYYLDRMVTRQFEGRRWTLPAQVYAAPLELYDGLAFSGDDVEQELRRLQYRKVEKLERPGTFRRQGSRIDVALRAAQFADEMRPAQVLAISTDATSITAIRDSKGEEVPIVRLEPLLIGSIFPIHGEDRIVVTPDQVPPLLPAALKAVEDRKFDTHHGIDPSAIARAMWANLRAGGIAQGGSTLTQQLVRSYFLTTDQTLSRKFREAVMAIALESHFTKADLMNAYINEIYLGQDGQRAVHGFGLASQFYFGKPLAELDLSEVALLVAVVRGPSYYDPRRRPQRVLARRNLVLKILAEQGVISDAAAKAAAKRPLGVLQRSSGGYYPAYLDFVRRTLRRDYKEEELTQAGLRIFTNLDPRAQESAEQTLEHELARLDRTHAAAVKKRAAKNDNSQPLEGAVVVTSPQSGDVIAIVGGRRVGYNGFDRALDAVRPMGSLVKPFVYLTALETKKYTAATIIQDEPVDVQLRNGTHWRPVNFTKEVYGPVPVVRALAESLNLATVGLGLDVGLPNVTKTLMDFGLTRRPVEVPSMLLGSVSVTPIEAAQLFGGLANGGFRTPLRAVRAVISADGKPLRAFPLEVDQVADSESVYQLNRMLELVMERGTGRAARAVLPPGLVVAGKSGTSSDQRDSWFAGFSGSHLAVVWVGYDDNSPTEFTGSSGALAVWARLMASLHTTSRSPGVPENIVDVPIEFTTGLRAAPGCAEDVVTVALPAGSEPPFKPGCGPNGAQGFLDRAGEWLRDMIRR
ncbi:MAG TPA: penicillin-binding protein 1B [Steroidobacteraceae bacterium]|jgi:penicillin-binding protein 1B|nr:penicillin-binding protein 1B [Steroidobacteraceae bacterium]